MWRFFLKKYGTVELLKIFWNCALVPDLDLKTKMWGYLKYDQNEFENFKWFECFATVCCR